MMNRYWKWWNMPIGDKIALVIRILFHEALLFPYFALLFYFVGGFSLRGMASLMILYWFMWAWSTQNMRGIQALRNEISSPYEVHINPNLPKMLRDLGLVSPEWDKPARPGKFPWSPIHIFEDGILAVVLRSDGVDKLIHWTGPNRYTRKLEYHQELDFVKLTRAKDESPAIEAIKTSFYGMEWSPKFFFRYDLTDSSSLENEKELKFGDGYKIGIAVYEDWWESNKDRILAAGIVKDVSKNGAWTDITLAVLPLRAFNLIDWKWMGLKGRQKLRDEIIREFPSAGWKPLSRPGAGADDTIDSSGEAWYYSDFVQVWVRHVR
jgi:hypothetical protein